MNNMKIHMIGAVISTTLALSGASLPVHAQTVQDTPAHTESVDLASEAGLQRIKDGVFETKEITNTRPFFAFAATWKGKKDIKVEARLLADNQWSQWNALGILEAEQTNPSSTHGTELFSRNAKYTGYQIRVNTAEAKSPEKIKAVLIDPGTRAQDSQLASETTDARTKRSAPGDETSTKVSKPRIISRAQWGADESKTSWEPEEMQKPEGIVLHHTVNNNTYTPEEAPRLVRAIHLYHAQERNWGDIGYQYPVDRFGNIYEGRKGSIDKEIIAAHAYGHNSFSQGIALIGDHSSTPIPAKALNSVVKVAAWKLSTWGKNAQGTVQVTNKATGKEENIQRIAGHRDSSTTICPGDSGYKELPRIRKRTQQLIDKAAKVKKKVKKVPENKPPLYVKN